MSDLPGRPTHSDQRCRDCGDSVIVRIARSALGLLWRGEREGCPLEGRDLFEIVPPRAGGTTGGGR